MPNEQPRIYDRLPEETDRQWLAFTCYRDLGLQRTTARAYTNYLLATGRGKNRLPSNRGGQVCGNFIKWKRDHRWDERIRAWDKEGEDRLLALRLQAEGRQYTENLTAFQRQVEAIGMAGLQLAATALSVQIQQLAPIAKKLTMNPQDRTPLTEEEAAIWDKMGKPRDLLAIATMSKQLLADSYDLGTVLKRIEEISDPALSD